MKTTKIGVMMAAMGLLAVGVGGAQAQGAKRAAARQERKEQTRQQTQMSMLEQLNLTPAQKKQVESIAEAEKTQLKSIQQNAALSPTDRKTQEKAAYKEARTKVLAVLTPAQKAQMKQLVAERRQKRENAAGTPTSTAPAAGTPGTPAPPAGDSKAG